MLISNLDDRILEPRKDGVTITLLPGENEVDPKAWKKVKGSKFVKKRLGTSIVEGGLISRPAEDSGDGQGVDL